MMRLALLLEAGHAPVRALACLARNRGPEAEVAVVAAIHARVMGGATIAQALGEWPRMYPPHVVGMIRAGEASGRLPEVAADAARMLEDGDRLRRETVSLLIYPAILALLAVAIFCLVVFAVLPQFESVFAEISGEASLPALTRGFLTVGRVMRAHPTGVVAGFFGAVVVVVWALRCGRVRRAVGAMALRTPVVSDWLHWQALYAMARLLGAGLRGGMGVMEGLDLGRGACPVGGLDAQWTRARGRIAAGEPAAAVLSELSFCNNAAGGLIAMSSEHGDLARTLDQVAQIAQRELELRRRRLAALIEPVMVLLLAGFVGMVVASLFLPMAGLIRAFSAG